MKVKLLFIFILTLLIVRNHSSNIIEDDNDNDNINIENNEIINENVIEIDSSNIVDIIYKSKQIWILYFYHSTECGTPCEQINGIFNEAASLTKGIALFGKIDLDDNNNKKLALELGIQGVPTLRVFTKEGNINKYNNKFWRPSKVYNGQMSARSIRKVLENELNDIHIEIVTNQNYTLFYDTNVKNGKSSVLLFSTKERISPFIKAISKIVNNSAVVGQVNPKDIELSKRLNINKTPSIVVISLENENYVFDESLNNKKPKQISEFILKYSPENNDVDNDSINKSNNNINEGNKVKNKTENLLNILDKIKKTSQPSVVAFYLNKFDDSDKIPNDEWTGFAKKISTWGYGTSIIICDDFRNEKIELPIDCKELEDKYKTNGWKFKIYKYFDIIPDLPFSDSYDSESESEIERETVVVDTTSEAKEEMMESIPDRVMRVNGQIFSGWISTILTSNDGGVPVLLIGKSNDVPAMYLSLASVLKGIASFAYMGNPSETVLQQVGLPPTTKLPTLISFIQREDDETDVNNNKQQELQIAMYNKAQFGKFSFQSMSSFIISVSSQRMPDKVQLWLSRYGIIFGVDTKNQEQSRSTNSNNNNEKINKKDSIIQSLDNSLTNEIWNEKCKSKSGNLICIIGFYDGNSANTELNNQIDVLKQVYETSKNRISAAARYSFLWVDATCHENFSKQFDIDLTILPGIVLYHPGKNLFMKYVQSYNSPNILSFLESIKTNQGRGFSALKHNKDDLIIDDINCDEIDSRQIIDDDNNSNDDDMEDMLAEIRAEEERERKKRIKEAKEQAKIERKLEEERKQKEKLKAEEAANKKTKSKKKKKKKKSKKVKDEL